LLTIAILVIQIMASASLIFLILLHSGKGGGLSDMFGGSVGQAAAGSTVVERNLDRITITLPWCWQRARRPRHRTMLRLEGPRVRPARPFLLSWAPRAAP
jgi:preprotein translocase subunit SecG